MEPGQQQGLQRTTKSWGSGLHLGGLADGGAPAAWNSALPRGPVAEVLRPSAGGAVLTKMVCTLGPTSRDVPVLEALLAAGMSAARIDFSWGGPAYHRETLDNLNRAMQNTNQTCAVIMDTKGPEIVISLPEEGAKVPLQKGSRIKLTSDPGGWVSPQAGAMTTLPVQFPDLGHLEAGTEVFVGQYLFTGMERSSAFLTVEGPGPEEGSLICLCNNEATLEGLLLTVHFSNARNSLPCLTQDDHEAIAKWKSWAGQVGGVDFLSLSFTRSAEDVRTAREALDRAGLADCQILAKVESVEGLQNLDEILDLPECYGCVVSRGNLGMDIRSWKMVRVQKAVLEACNLRGKSAIVTRVCDSMVSAPRPTRAEATDIANAVLDGADAIMLGAETLRGKHPVGTVEIVRLICREAEQCYDHAGFYRKIMEYEGGAGANPSLSQQNSLSSSAVRAAEKTAAACIIAFTETGRHPRVISKYRPSAPVIAPVLPRVQVTVGLGWRVSGQAQCKRLMLSRGVIPLLVNSNSINSKKSTMDNQVVQFALGRASEKGLVGHGDRIIVSQRVRQSSILRVATVGEDVMFPGDPRMKQLRRLGADFGSTDDLSSLSRRESETSGNGMQYLLEPESDLV